MRDLATRYHQRPDNFPADINLAAVRIGIYANTSEEECPDLPKRH